VQHTPAQLHGAATQNITLNDQHSLLEISDLSELPMAETASNIHILQSRNVWRVL
jgi:hypothetical protein